MEFSERHIITYYKWNKKTYVKVEGKPVYVSI